jgi:hypothetical protein
MKDLVISEHIIGLTENNVFGDACPLRQSIINSDTIIIMVIILLTEKLNP